MWRGAKARLARMQRALPALQAALRRYLSAPRLKTGARVRLAAGAAARDERQVAYATRGTNTLTHDTYGTVAEIKVNKYVTVASDDGNRRFRYDFCDLEPIVDGDSTAALVFERKRHTRRHKAAVRLQALTRGRLVRRQHAAAARVRAQVRCALSQIRSRCAQAAQRLQAHVRCATARSRLRLQPPSSPGAPAFTFGGIGR